MSPVQFRTARPGGESSRPETGAEGSSIVGLFSALIVACALACGTASQVEGASFTEVRDGLEIQVSARPDPPREGEWVTYTVGLRHASGAPLVGATVKLTGGMADGMAVRADLRPAGTDGVYSGRLLLTMQGRWDMRLTIAHPRGTREIRFTEQVTGR